MEKQKNYSRPKRSIENSQTARTIAINQKEIREKTEEIDLFYLAVERINKIDKSPENISFFIKIIIENAYLSINSKQILAKKLLLKILETPKQNKFTEALEAFIKIKLISKNEIKLFLIEHFITNNYKNSITILNNMLKNHIIDFDPVNNLAKNHLYDILIMAENNKEKLKKTLNKIAQFQTCNLIQEEYIFTIINQHISFFFIKEEKEETTLYDIKRYSHSISLPENIIKNIINLNILSEKYLKELIKSYLENILKNTKTIEEYELSPQILNTIKIMHKHFEKNKQDILNNIEYKDFIKNFIKEIIEIYKDTDKPQTKQEKKPRKTGIIEFNSIFKKTKTNITNIDNQKKETTIIDNTKNELIRQLIQVNLKEKNNAIYKLLKQYINENF